MTYPPPYNPALTLNSRRYFTLPPVSVSASTFASLLPRSSRTGSSIDDCTLVGSSSAASSIATSSAVAPPLCSTCIHDDNTYLVEIINYPDLQLPGVRKQVHAKADYDAILLVYDVTSSASFDAVAALYAEIPTRTTRKGHLGNHQRTMIPRRTSSTRSRTGGWFGVGGNRGSEMGVAASGEIVVGLVGNRCDIDDEGQEQCETRDEALAVTMASAEHGPSPAVTEDDLLHPLYRECILYEELMAAASLKDRQPECKMEKTKTEEIREAALPTRPIRTEATTNNDIYKWLQIGRPVPPSLLSLSLPDESRPPSGIGAPATQSGRLSSATTETSGLRRQVSPADGAMLAQALQLSVPFLETSAKTSHNVERALEQLVRAVLLEIRQGASGERRASKTCRHRVAEKEIEREKKKKKRRRNEAEARSDVVFYSREMLQSVSRSASQSAESSRTPVSASSLPRANIAAQRPASAVIFADATSWADEEEVGVAVSTNETVTVAPLISSSYPSQPLSLVQSVSLSMQSPVQRRGSLLDRICRTLWGKAPQ